MQRMDERSRRGRRSAANGIDWKDDAPGWWLAGLKRRERIAVGGKKARTPWIPYEAYEATGEEGCEGRARGTGGWEGVPIKS